VERETITPSELKMVYIRGFGSTMTISKIKAHLYKLKFLLTKIRNIRYVGISTVEFMIEESYYIRFMKRFQGMDTHFTIIENYNLVKNPWENIPDQEFNSKIRSATQRIYKSSMKSNDRTVQIFFSELIDSLGPVAIKEAERCNEEIDRTSKESHKKDVTQNSDKEVTGQNFSDSILVEPPKKKNEESKSTDISEIEIEENDLDSVDLTNDSNNNLENEDIEMDNLDHTNNDQ
jgi:hypothetical protein